MIESSTPPIDPISKNSYRNIIESSSVGNGEQNNQNCCTNNMNLQKIYPGIYLTSEKNICSAESLKFFGFTHIIYIDKHIIIDDASTSSLAGGTSNLSKNCSQPNHNVRSQTARIDSNGNRRGDIKTVNALITKMASITSMASVSTAMPPLSSSTSVFTSPVSLGSCARSTHKNGNIFGRNDFETLDLNFGESSYVTTVLPNCYKAVKFIETALKNNGAVLVIDCIGENQKCITIVVGFLMYKYNKNFL